MFCTCCLLCPPFFSKARKISYVDYYYLLRVAWFFCYHYCRCRSDWIFLTHTYFTSVCICCIWRRRGGGGLTRKNVIQFDISYIIHFHTLFIRQHSQLGRALSLSLSNVRHPWTHNVTGSISFKLITCLWTLSTGGSQ